MANIHPEIRKKSLQKRYNKVCEKLEVLNEEAFEIENEMRLLNLEIENEKNEVTK